MNDITRSIAPFIRGLYPLGETGAYVRCSSETATGDRTGADAAENLLPPMQITEDSSPGEKLAKEYGEYCVLHGYHPAVIRVGKGGVLIAGRSFDDMAAIERKYLESGGSPSSLMSRYEPDSTMPASAATRGGVAVDRISVVTGGAQGFGESIVRELVDAGAFVWVADLNTEGAEKLCNELNTAAGKTVSASVGVNVMDEASVAAMVESIIEGSGGIDLFISNAGVVKAGSVKELSVSDFQFVTNVNYTGYFLGVKHVAPVMALQNQATGRYYSDIIQINSKSGLEGSNKNGAYAGGKFGGIGLTQSFALELVEDNIKVNSICPGNFFDGPLWSDPERGLFVTYLKAGKVPGAKTVEEVKKFYEAKVPMGRGCTGADVVKAIYYIIDQKYETGQAVPVTGGQVMLR